MPLLLEQPVATPAQQRAADELLAQAQRSEQFLNERLAARARRRAAQLAQIERLRMELLGLTQAENWP